MSENDIPASDPKRPPTEIILTDATPPPPEAMAPPIHDFVVSTPPHLKAEQDVPTIMKLVCIGLIPAFMWGGYIFGYYALVVTAICVISCVLTESFCCWMREIPSATGDWSAVVTGLLLAAVIPPNVSWWVPILGAVFAIALVKHSFGGLGHNIWNPALLSRAFLQNACPSQMNSGVWAHLGTGGGFQDIASNYSTSLNGSFDQLAKLAENHTDVMSGATALTKIQAPVSEIAGSSIVEICKANGAMPSYSAEVLRSAFGAEGGCIAEVSAIALLVGGLLLLARNIIKWEIPVCFLAALGVLTFILPAPYKIGDVTQYTAWFSGPWLLHLVGGGAMIGAFFMATDYVTSPMSKTGRIVFGLGCGALTAIIRLYAGYPEGVCYAILIMNTCVPLIDSWTRPVKFGAPKAA